MLARDGPHKAFVDKHLMTDMPAAAN